VGGPYGVDIVRYSTGLVIGNDFITQSVDVVLPLPTFVTSAQDIFNVVLQRLSSINKPIQVDFITAMNYVTDIIFRRLLVRNDDLAKGSFSLSITAPPVYSPASTYTLGQWVNYANSIYQANTPITVPEAWNAAHWTAVDATQGLYAGALPSDFFGFCERPFIQGMRWLLNPLPNECRAAMTSPSTPQYYELRGMRVTIFPIPTANLVLDCQYYAKPVPFALLTDGVPWDGLFDLAIQESVIQVCMSGLGVLADKTFNAILYKQVDEVLSFRSPKQVRFFQTIEGGQRGPMGVSPYYR